MKKYYFLIILTVILGLVLTGCSLLSNVGQVPTTGQSGVTYLTKSDVDNPHKIRLMAGKTDYIGDVLVWNDSEKLYVKFVYNGSECGFLEVHLQVDETEFSNYILTKKGNPIPGKFENSFDEGCFTEMLFTYNLVEENFGCDGDVLKIAAHAVVPSGQVNVDNLTGSVYATNVFSVNPGTNAVRDPLYTLGEPDSEYNEGDTFYSLGIEGCIELEFEDFVGGTLTVYEVTWQHEPEFTKYPLESADISVSADGANWTYLDKADNSGQSSSNLPIPNVFDLEECIKYVRICDTTDLELHTGAYNAFDLDAIEAEYYCEKETAWGGDTPFDGKNWATYFDYTVGCAECPSITASSEINVCSLGDVNPGAMISEIPQIFPEYSGSDHGGFNMDIVGDQVKIPSTFVAAGTPVCSYYVHFDNDGVPKVAVGSITFSKPVMGLIVAGTINTSDIFCKKGINTMYDVDGIFDAGITYPIIGDARGLEIFYYDLYDYSSQDNVWILGDTVFFKLSIHNKHDSFRIIVSPEY